ncbi:MAG: FtsX-like permease family protein [Bacteroidales bacterium]
MITAIAWRNIWRHRLRSMVVMLAAALGIFGTLFMIALSNGVVEQKIADSIHNETSHIQIHKPEFLQDNVLQHAMQDASEISNVAQAIPGIKGVSSRIKTMAMASTASNGAGVIINGIDPETEKLVTGIAGSVIDGTYFEGESRSPQILISRKLAGNLKAKTGSRIVITIQNTDGELIYGLFRVAGIYKTANALFDEPNVFVRRSDLAELTGFDPALSTEIALLLQRTEDTDKTVAMLEEIYPGLSILPWYVIEPTLNMLSGMMDQFSYFLLVIILAAMAFGIVNTMLMSILERTRELGMLMAVGMNKKKVFIMIMLETIFLSGVGALVGVAMSYLTITLTSRNGINFAAWADGFESLGYSALIYPTIYASFYFWLAVLVMITAMFASVFPARKALKLNPAEAIRHEA